MQVKYATANAIINRPGGGAVRVRKGSHWPTDDPIVQAQPSLFSDDPRWGLEYSVQPDGFDDPVEQATAAPGEKRNVRRS
jgi:hypothetical protein